MGWYKIRTGMPQDIKLAVVMRRSGMRRGEVFALWAALHDHAANAVPRGSVRGLDAEEVAALLEFDPAAIVTALKALRERKMILADDMLAGWARSQQLSTPRTRAFRARAAARETDADRRVRLQKEMHKRGKS